MSKSLKDVFISHSWVDKAVIEPLIVNLSNREISYWYDSVEMKPGDSLVDKINQGLTNCRIVLFFISESFINGTWTNKELGAAFSLSMLNVSNKSRLIPIFMTDVETIIQKYPLQFGSIFYINWDPLNLDRVIDQIESVLKDINRLNYIYWFDKSIIEYNLGNYSTACIYSVASISSSPNTTAPTLVRTASLLRLNQIVDAFQSITDIGSDFEDFEEVSKLDKELVDYVQDVLSGNVTEEIVKRTHCMDALLDLFTSIRIRGVGSKYLKRLYINPVFNTHRKDIIYSIAITDKQKSIPWLKDIAINDPDNEIREVVANAIYILAEKVPKKRSEIIEIAELLSYDCHEEVRTASLATIYNFADNGELKVIEKLNDKSPEVRIQAIDLLTGALKVKVDRQWIPEVYEPEAEDQKPSKFLDKELVEQLLKDPDPDVFETIYDAVEEGVFSFSDQIDLTEYEMPHDSESREHKVRLLAKHDSNETFHKLINYAMHDPDEFVRSEAIEALRESRREIDEQVLRDLWRYESVWDVEKHVAKLIIDKGGSSLGDIFVEIMQRFRDSLFTFDNAYYRVQETQDDSFIHC